MGPSFPGVWLLRSPHINGVTLTVLDRGEKERLWPLFLDHARMTYVGG